MNATNSPPVGDGDARTPAAREAHTPRVALLLTLFLVALYVAARLWRLTANCLWFDEIFSVHSARHTWGGLWRFAAADLIHPPLFYALLKVWVALGGESLLWLRLFPALTSFAALVPFFLLARELRLGARATQVALLLMAADGYLVKYAQEVRMYSLLLALALLSLWLFARLRNSERASRTLLAALTLANLALVYTHYYGWLVVACEAAFLILKDGRKLLPFSLSVAALAVCFAPWVLACLNASREGGGLAQNIGWIERPRAEDLTQLFALLNEPFYFRQSSAEPPYARGGALLGLILVGLPILFFVVKALRRRADTEGESTRREDLRREGARGGAAQAADETREATLMLLLFTLAPVAVVFAASHVLPDSVWGTRHLIVVAAPYMLLAGLALDALRPAWLKSAALVALSCWLFAVGALTLARSEGAYVWCAWGGLAESAARDDAQAEAGESKTRGGETRPVNVFAFEDLVAYHLWFALDGHGEGRFRVVVLKNVPGVAEDPAYFLPRDFDGVGVAHPDALVGERFYAAFRDTEWDESHEPLRLILERGYRAERVYETAAQGQRAFLVLFTREGGKE